jgi:hypothetical protein
MGLFDKQKSLKKARDKVLDAELDFLDKDFHDEMRDHGRWYFEKVIDRSAALFKKDLDATVKEIDVELKEHVVTQLNRTISRLNLELKGHIEKRLEIEFAEYSQVMKNAQDEAMKELNQSARSVQDEHQKLSTTIQKSIANQKVMIDSLFQENMEEMKKVKEAQTEALKVLQESVNTVKAQQQEIETMLKENVTKQQDRLIEAFEGNMANVIEHYLLGALGDQYDLKAQLPSIIKQMEENKKVIADDMKL